MGFDLQRFPNGIDEELICTGTENNEQTSHVSLHLGAICGGVLQDPVQAPGCEHAFCQVGRRSSRLTHSLTMLVVRLASMNGSPAPRPARSIERRWKWSR